LYSDVRSLARQSGFVFPKFARFQWHPLNKENQRWPLECDGDWLRLSSYWEGNKHKCIPIYLIELKKASSIQLTVASIDRGTDNAGVSQPEIELSLELLQTGQTI